MIFHCHAIAMFDCRRVTLCLFVSKRFWYCHYIPFGCSQKRTVGLQRHGSWLYLWCPAVKSWSSRVAFNRTSTWLSSSWATWKNKTQFFHVFHGLDGYERFQSVWFKQMNLLAYPGRFDNLFKHHFVMVGSHPTYSPQLIFTCLTKKTCLIVIPKQIVWPWKLQFSRWTSLPTPSSW